MSPLDAQSHTSASSTAASKNNSVRKLPGTIAGISTSLSPPSSLTVSTRVPYDLGGRMYPLRCYGIADVVSSMAAPSLSVGIETTGGVFTNRHPTRRARSSRLPQHPAWCAHAGVQAWACTYRGQRLGKFELSGIPRPRGVPQVEVTFHIDADGQDDRASPTTRAVCRRKRSTVWWTTRKVQG
ncbi:hypothetical protein B0H16DRAFT_162904 [Mycena metata]|uniref:Uncharacterized protein n=1 Tax=Mycena metata TaxID=1033252 RepID=A0AAD7I2E0_9AGAR|nr:hypothetical protein B0H16DRAFT_162904 [Mycena metata]